MGDLSVAAMNGRLEVEEKRSLVLACLRAATSYALRALALSVFQMLCRRTAQQVTQVRHLSVLTPKHGNASG